MKRTIRLELLSLVVFAVFLAFAGPAEAIIWTPVDYPYQYYSLTGIHAGVTVGHYTVSGNSHAFKYDGQSFETLDYPGAEHTFISGISGTTIVGTVFPGSGYHGFVYNEGSWQAIHYADSTAYRTMVNGIDGSRIFGKYRSTDYKDRTEHGFIYDGSNWSTIDYPGALETEVVDIYDNKLIGLWRQQSGPYYNSFLYDGTNWTTLAFPNTIYTQVTGIDGDTIVGVYQGDFDGDHHGFLFDGTTWMTLDFPGADTTHIEGINGDIIFGRYLDEEGYHQFTAVIPEPATLILLGFGGLLGSFPKNKFILVTK